MTDQIVYDKDRNEVEIWGCSTCPFLWYDEIGEELTPFCCFEEYIDLPYMSNSNHIPDHFPENCPLRDPNFKLVRHIVETQEVHKTVMGGT